MDPTSLDSQDEIRELERRLHAAAARFIPAERRGVPIEPGLTLYFGGLSTHWTPKGTMSALGYQLQNSEHHIHGTAHGRDLEECYRHAIAEAEDLAALNPHLDPAEPTYTLSATG